MFSILIPTYNYDCTELVTELRTSCLLAHIDFEIIIGNDCSTDPQVVQALQDLDKVANCRVVTEDHNIGRAFILNHLALLAAYPYLIIIDSDARLPNADFITNYIKAAVENDVVCGGIITRMDDKTYNNHLRLRYESSAAHIRSLDYRRHHPYENFSTFNLLIRHSIFSMIPFDAHCTQYGYEDTILGFDLQHKGVKVCHIDNPLIHTGIDSNRSFLSKTRKALQVLSTLDLRYRKQIRLSRMALKLKKCHLLWAMRLWHKLFGTLEEKILLTSPRLFVFYLYKLGHYSLLETGE